MSEVKFRAWDVLNHKMIYDIQNCYDSKDGDSFRHFLHTRFDPDADNDEICEIVSELPHKYIVEQYIMMKDKNSQDIYDGDIGLREVECSDEYPEQFMPRVPACPKTRTWIEKQIRAITMTPEIRYGGQLIIKHTSKVIEVIGNIHENQDLLA